MKNLQINIPTGYEIDEKLSTFTNIVFKPIVLKITPEQRMLEIWKSCNIVKYSKDNYRTYFKDTEPMFQQDWKNKKLYYRYSLVYKIFEKEFQMSEKDIDNLVITILSRDLNCNGLEGGAWGWSRVCGWVLTK